MLPPKSCAHVRRVNFGVSGANMTYEINIAHQLKMLDDTWLAFERNGVTDETEVELEFTYVAPGKDAAVALNSSLENYESVVRSDGLFRRKWYV